MKTKLLGLLSGLTLFSSMAIADDVVIPPLVVPISVDKVFVPNGFDDNDNVEVIVHGHFKNSCYRAGTALGIVDDLSKTVEISVKALYYSDENCLQMTIPFTHSVKLGMLPVGTYTASALNATESQPVTFTVVKAPKSSADDYLYAPVDHVDVLTDTTEASKKTLVLQGTFPKIAQGCMFLKEVKAFRSPEDVLVVLPISDVTYDATYCATRLSPTERRFHSTLDVGNQLISGAEMLVHVRVLNGMSLNKVIEVE